MLVQKNGFWTIDGKRYYYRDGKKVINKIIKVENASYYCGATGEIQTGWQTIGDNKYYFAANGIMKTGKVKIGSFYYYFAANGIMKTGKVEDKEFKRTKFFSARSSIIILLIIVILYVILKMKGYG
jgi:glucan-binding YG repeat protein